MLSIFTQLSCTAKRIREDNRIEQTAPDPIGSQRVYKKTSSNQLLTLYLGSRELISRGGIVEPLKGVIYIDSKIFSGYKIYGQITLTFRYGREDEEVMGLKFCNEAVISLKQLWPKISAEVNRDENTPLQDALLERLGKNAIGFSIEINTVAPPSVQLLPAKRYLGAPIGTSYDIRIFTDIDGVFSVEQTDEIIHRRSTVRLGIRLTHKICPETNILAPEHAQNNPTPRSLRLRLSPKSFKLSKQSCSLDGTTSTNSEIDRAAKNDKLNKGPERIVEKPFLWTEGRLYLKATLNKYAFTHGEDIAVTIDVKNESKKIIRKIKVYAVQHVDVCMFSNGKFKNIVALLEVEKYIGSNEEFHGTYNLLPVRGTTKNWIAVEGALFNTSCTHDTNLIALSSKLASSAPRDLQSSGEKNVFAIYVSYYVKVKLTLGGIGGEVSLKLPFVLGDIESNLSSTNNKTKMFTTTTKSKDCIYNNVEMKLKDVYVDVHKNVFDHDIIQIANESTNNKSERFTKIETSDSAEIASEDLKNTTVYNNCDNYVKTRSDSSKSYLDNLVDNSKTTSESNSNNVIQAQIHFEEKKEPKTV
ncbi:phosrestin-2 [Culicoides brevitarsis]|uniref:phosrestin-2 n=1 Tax=Culicoides brevitarsis TaxID=469753 RepID=UPI00307B64F8